MINGIETREFGDSSEHIVSKKKLVSTQNIEETKINFFNPRQYLDQEEELMYDLEKKEDEQIIEGKIDPQEWKREIERVYKDLDNIERDLQLIRTRG